jgi:hypothetical protein
VTPPSPKRLHLLLLHGGVLALFCVLAVFHTWPLARDLSGHLVWGKEDVFMNVWHLKWMRHALWEAPQNPYFTPMLHHPMGAELYWHTLSPAKTGWGAVLLGFMQAETAYNLILLSTFVLAGYTAWLLCRYLLRRAGFSPRLADVAALAGACAFTFSRYHLVQAIAHLNLSAIEGIPLYLYFFLRWQDEGRKKLLWGVGLSALYVVLCDYYYLFYLALFCALWVVGERWQRGRLLSVKTLQDAGVRRSLWAAGAAGVASLPGLLPLLLNLKPEPYKSHHGDSDYYADLAALFMPDPLSAWRDAVPQAWTELTDRLVRATMANNHEESGYFLGWGVVVLAMLALRWGVPQGKRWFSIGLCFLVLSLGTMLQVAGHRTHSPVTFLLFAAGLVLLVARRSPDGEKRHYDVLAVLLLCAGMGLVAPYTAFGQPAEVMVPLPYVVFKSVVPFFGRAGMPVRFGLMVTLVLAVLLSFAAAHLGTWASRRKAALGLGVASLIAVVPNVEYRHEPMRMVPVPELPAIFEEIAREPPEVAVITDHVVGQWEQLYHGHPVSFARQSRTPLREAVFEESRLFNALHRLNGCQAPVSPAEQEEMRGYLKEHHFRYYVAHRFHPACDRFVREVLGGETAHSGGWVTVYRFPWVPAGG